MARREDMTDDNDATHNYGIFAVNETSVGKRGQNSRRSDIQLVQFFLKNFFRVNTHLAAELPKTKSGIGSMALDGKYGPQTEAGIGIFQKWAQSQGKQVKVDNLVSVPRGVQAPESKNYYTILLMNAWFQKYGDQNNDHGELQYNIDIATYAPELMNDLARPVSNKI